MVLCVLARAEESLCELVQGRSLQVRQHLQRVCWRWDAWPWSHSIVNERHWFLNSMGKVPSRKICSQDVAGMFGVMDSFSK
mmetsp:Transcript_1174/g.3050  ORF Transcript_1174/g.3050 Transcript_1174/m.3050 type:complete len:81 (-) Transcript_1174:1136-1378(-)